MPALLSTRKGDVLCTMQGQGADYTARRRPVRLVYREPHTTKSAARRRESQIKAWRADKKEQLVRGFPSTGSG